MNHFIKLGNSEHEDTYGHRAGSAEICFCLGERAQHLDGTGPCLCCGCTGYVPMESPAAQGRRAREPQPAQIGAAA